jgi:hypothetical protein
MICSDCMFKLRLGSRHFNFLINCKLYEHRDTQNHHSTLNTKRFSPGGFQGVQYPYILLVEVEGLADISSSASSKILRLPALWRGYRQHL